MHTLGMAETTGDWLEDALNLVARMPRVMGLLFRYREGRSEGIPRTTSVLVSSTASWRPWIPKASTARSCVRCSTPTWCFT